MKAKTGLTSLLHLHHRSRPPRIRCVSCRRIIWPRYIEAKKITIVGDGVRHTRCPGQNIGEDFRDVA